MSTYLKILGVTALFLFSLSGSSIAADLNFDLGGNLETKLRYTGKSDITDDSSDSTITLSASTVEIGLETQIGDLATGSIVFLTEDIGDEDAGDDAGEAVLIDEATITLKKEGKPMYAVLGSRTQPFGAFYSHTINDPLTQDLYEIGEAGITIGAEFSKGDVSITLYRGQGHRDHLLGSGHYGVGDLDADGADDIDWMAMTDGVVSADSIILSAQFSIIEALNFGISYSNEKGEDASNSTFGVNLDFTKSKFAFELEYIMALSRDKYAGVTKEYKEKAASVGIAFAASDALEIAGRYEFFDDASLVDGENGWAINTIIVLGVNYTISSDEESGTDIYTAAEFRSFSYDVDSSLSTRADSNSEFTVVLGIDF